MYESFYGLTRAPFAVTPDPAMLFMSKVHREALATIIYGVDTRKGFIVCTGEVGTGKSTIVRAFFDQTSAGAITLIYTFTPQVSPFEMARYICGELGLDDPDSVFAAVPKLQLKLLEEFEAGRTVVLMIDEAQLLPPETLEFLRLLSNFETDAEKLIQIVLVGQPEVDTMLARRDMRQVNQRVALRARLGPFGVEESFAYIEHRLQVSGAQDMAQVMSPTAGWYIAEAAGGIPRVINILADNALIAGFGMAQRPLGSRLAGNAVREFLGRAEAAPRPRVERFAAGWRAVRRLRNALSRERDEPLTWTPAVPPPVTRGRTAKAAGPVPSGSRISRPRVPEPRQSGVSEGSANARSAPAVAPEPVFIPATTVLQPLPAPAEPQPATAPQTLAEPMAPIVEQPPNEPVPLFVEPTTTVDAPVPSPVEAVPIYVEPVALIEPAATASEPIPIYVEPVPMAAEALPMMVEPVLPTEHWGVPVAAAGIPVIEPTHHEAADRPHAKPQRAVTALAIPPWPQDAGDGAMRPERTISFIEERRAPAAVSRERRAIAPSTVAPSTVAPPTVAVTPARWPALSRVRDGLQASPRGH